MTDAEAIQVQTLNHLGIIAGIIDEMGLVEEINQLLGTHPKEIVSPGHIVKAMILNGMGFVSAPLYLFHKFFEGKAIKHLIGEGVKPEHLNDDRLGRVLDQLYVFGLTRLFINIAHKATVKFGIATKSLHLDSSSFHVHGEGSVAKTSGAPDCLTHLCESEAIEEGRRQKAEGRRYFSEGDSDPS